MPLGDLGTIDTWVAELTTSNQLIPKFMPGGGRPHISAVEDAETPPDLFRTRSFEKGVVFEAGSKVVLHRPTCVVFNDYHVGAVYEIHGYLVDNATP